MAALDQAAFVAALFDSAHPPPAGLTTARGEADAMRFAVYRNNVAISLAKILEQRFPVCVRLVGEGFFRMMAHAFIAKEKPSSPLMFFYGDGLPDFIATFAPAESTPYLADVARIERAWSNAYHAADQAPLSVADISAVDVSRLVDLRLVVHPAAALISSAWPVGSIWGAHQSDEPAPAHLQGAETVLVVRPDMEVGVRILPKYDARFAEALFAGEAVGAAAEAAIKADQDFDFGRAIVGLVGLGAFAAMAEI